METMEAGKGLHRLVWQASSQARIRDKILPSPSRLSAPCKVPAGSESENESLSVVSDSLRPLGLYSPCNSPGQKTGVGSLSLHQGIFPTWGQNPGLLHCRQFLYQLSHKGSPKYWNGSPIPSPVALPDPGIQLVSPALQAVSLPAELQGKLPLILYYIQNELKIYQMPKCDNYN